jgi:hypothetical protein
MTSRILSGAWQPKTSSSVIEAHRNLDAGAGAAGEAAFTLFLLSLGVLIVVLHASFHWPLHLPGHHGLEAMSLMMLGRGLTRRPWAATIVAAGAGAATFIPAFAPNDLASSWQYLLIGVTLDAIFRVGAGWRRSALFLATIAALAYAAKPLSKWLLLGSFNFHFGSLRDGLLMPLSAHLAFGFAGGLIGAWMAIATRRAYGDRR